jgi:5-methylcytosine-specific restriction endonuclease McrA
VSILTPKKQCTKCLKWKACNGAIANQWKRDNPDRVRAVREKYLETNLEAERERTRQWQQANPDRVKALNQKWYKEHPDWVREKHHERRALKNGNGGKFTAKQWRACKEFYGYTCLRCGHKEPEIKLTPDHVVPLKQGGCNSIDNIQPLCFSCNSSKKANHIDYRPVIFYG